MLIRGEALQAELLPLESNTPFPVGHLDTLWGTSGKDVDLWPLPYLDLLDFHVLCEMLSSEKSRVSKQENGVLASNIWPLEMHHISSLQTII